MKQTKNFQFYRILGMFLCLGLSMICFSSASFAEGIKYKKNETGLYRDIFDDNLYYELTSYLRLDRLYNAITGKKVRAKNVNVFDEVPDSAFFTNRHGRQKLSLAELERGYAETDGPDLSGEITVVKGKFEGLNPGFFVKDAKGDKYLFKFDMVDTFEMRTAAEVIASRFYHAIGYNVPQYTIAHFSPESLVPGEGAMVRDDTGFKKPLTAEKLEEYTLFLPQDENGNFRASASKYLSGTPIGYMSFNNRRKDDPNDLLDHRYRREIRALSLFASWLNNYDARDSNTLDVVVNENGKEYVKHYLIDFNSTLGSGVQAPMFTFEHMVDYGEATKAFFTLGWWEKPWQRRWREADEQINQSPAVGDFDNKGFKPEDFKTQLPYYPFKEVTNADGFWAAKIIMSFSDEEIRTIVKTGKYSDPDDEKYVADVLIERRDIIGRYWFNQVSPLDAFDLKLNSLVFEDLAVKYGFSSKSETTYLVDVYAGGKKNWKKIDHVELSEPSLDIASWLKNNKNLKVVIRTLRSTDSNPNSPVCVEFGAGGVKSIIHKD